MPGFLYPLTESSPWRLVLALGICSDEVLLKRALYLVQLGRWTVFLNFFGNIVTFLPVGTCTEDPLITKTSMMGKPGEDLEELATWQ